MEEVNKPPKRHRLTIPKFKDIRYYNILAANPQLYIFIYTFYNSILWY